MTLEEKISQTVNVSPAIPRLGIPEMDWWNEALHGVARAGQATVFPQTIGLAATFDVAEVQEMYDMVSDEARAKHHDFKRKNQFKRYQGLTFWTPNINIFRDPRWGRGMETYGEDPYLTTLMGVAVVKGLQGDGTQKYDKTHACAKHYAVHSGPEWNRHSYDAKNISQRDLRETYLPAFQALVQDAGVKEVMCAYNRFEGDPCCASDELLIHILREEWGFDDIIVSDCGAIDDFYRENRHETHEDAISASADAVITGTDLECGQSYAALTEAVKRGLITEEQIDVAVFRLLRARFELGMFDDDSEVSWASIPYSVVESQKHLDKAEEMARKSMVLLKNNGVLPLAKNAKIAVLGPNAADSIMLRANYNGFPTHSITILDGIKAKLPEADIYYRKACNHVGEQFLTSLIDNCSYERKQGIKATFWNTKDFSGPVAATDWIHTDIRYDNGGNTVIAPGVNLDDFSGRYQTTFTSPLTGEVEFRISTNDGNRLFINGEKVLDTQGSWQNPDLSYTLQAEAGEKYDITLEYYHQKRSSFLNFDLGTVAEVNYEEIAQKAAGCDVIVFVGGISAQLEGEEMNVDLPGFRQGDRTTIELPVVQQKMLQTLKATGKPVVFVMCSGSTIALPWENQNMDAIVAAWYPGQRGGNAVADVLFGDYNPAGRLPLTFYASTDDLPDFEDYDMTKGRTYRYFKGTPVYPFGHGLSYTTFEYKDAKLAKEQISTTGSTSLSVSVTNTGAMDGEEVVQVYIRNLQDPAGPLKSLRGFARVPVKAGETTRVEIDLPTNAFEFFDPGSQSVRVKEGMYEILYGGSSADQELKRLALRII